MNLFRGLKSDRWLVLHPFCFLQLCPLKGTGFERKNKLNFLIILSQNTLFLKEFLACNGCFGLFHKIRKGSGANFWSTFSAWFFHKNVPYLIFYQWTKFTHLIFFSKYQTKRVIKFLFKQLMTSWILRFFLDQPLRHWLTRKKRGEDRNTKIWICWIRKELFWLNKTNFS